MRKRILITRLVLGIVLLGLVLAIASTTSVDVLAGRMSIGIEGVDGFWVEPSSVVVTGTKIVYFRLYNDSSDTRVFHLEQIVPYDASIKDASDRVSLREQSITLDGKTEGVFSVRVSSNEEPGESWIRIQPIVTGQVQSALIIRIRVS